MRASATTHGTPTAWISAGAAFMPASRCSLVISGPFGGAAAASAAVAAAPATRAPTSSAARVERPKRPGLMSGFSRIRFLMTGFKTGGARVVKHWSPRALPALWVDAAHARLACATARVKERGPPERGRRRDVARRVRVQDGRPGRPDLSLCRGTDDRRRRRDRAGRDLDA